MSELIHSENGRAPNSTLRMRWTIPCHLNTPHRLEMEDGGVALWRKKGHEVKINERPQRERVTAVKGMELATSVVSCQRLQ